MIKVELSEKMKNHLFGFPKVFRYIYGTWARDCIKPLKESAQKLRKTARSKRAWGKSGELARNIGFELAGDEKEIKTTVGTGVGSAHSVIYAAIQDRGGTIRKKEKMLTIPLGNTVGRVADYDGFFVKSKKGNVLFCQRDSKKQLKPLFVLKDQVEIPATHWFSSVMEQRQKELERLLSPENVLKTSIELGAKK